MKYISSILLAMAASAAMSPAATISFDVDVVEGTSGATGFGGGIFGSTNMAITEATFTLGTFDAGAVGSAGADADALRAAFASVAGTSTIGTLMNGDAGLGPVPGTQTIIGYTVDDAVFTTSFSGNNLGLLVESGSDVGFFQFNTAVSDTNPDPTAIGFLANFNTIQASPLVGEIVSPGVITGGVTLDNAFQLEVVPEPSTSLLGLLGGIALLARRRR